MKYKRTFSGPKQNYIDVLNATERRFVDVRIEGAGGAVVYEQKGVCAPASWSDQAVSIVAQKYFHGLGSERECSVFKLIRRVVDAIDCQLAHSGLFHSMEDLEAYLSDLAWLLINQHAAFNSPVWFNIGVDAVPQQASACFILGVEDSMESILDWYRDEGMIFKSGSGSGANLSKIRASHEPLSGGGTASGPISFARGADSMSGVIKSGGRTRRAAKLLLLDVDHPDIDDFVWCKVREEGKAQALAQAGYDVGMNGTDEFSIQYQNANNSVRVSDAFMQAVLEGKDFELWNRTNGQTARKVDASTLFRQIAEAAHQCGCPGLHFADTVARWNPAKEEIRGSNPCSEFMFVDNSACNLASINLTKFIDGDGVIQYGRLVTAADILTIAMDALVDIADYPTEKIARNSKEYRPLGLGICGLGAALIELGLPYDSDDGRLAAASMQATVHFAALCVSQMLAEELGPYPSYVPSRQTTVILEHVNALHRMMAPPPALREILDGIDPGKPLRNAQLTALAPTGTIAFMMDIGESTGVEPLLALETTKKMAGGGEIVQETPACVGCYLKRTLQYALSVDDPVLATALGENTVSPEGHVQMLAALQPFVSGGISKTVNLPSSATVEDVASIYTTAWQLGVKAVAVYRDGSKHDQPVNVKAAEAPSGKTAPKPGGERHSKPCGAPLQRLRLPETRVSLTHKFAVGGQEGYLTVGLYPDGSPGEIFIRMSKQGSTIAGLLDAFAIAVSLGLQHGAPLQSYVAKMARMQFDPRGLTANQNDPDLSLASSVLDYVFRWIDTHMMAPQLCNECNLPTFASLGVGDTEADVAEAEALPVVAQAEAALDAEGICVICGSPLIRTGTCLTCTNCGTSNGCG